MFSNPRDTAPRAPRGFRPLAERPLAMLAHCPVYRPTPLASLPMLAQALGIGRLWVKDETHRMRLGSFKALGGVFAVAQLIAEAAGVDDPASPAARAQAARMTFVTASAGNHGLSVAAGARIFGAKAIVALDSSVPHAFAERIRRAGGTVLRLAGSYEDAVAHVSRTARENGWILLADGSWPGYVTRPALVMEGYTVLAEECRAALRDGGAWPSHVYLQAGVGGLAAAVAAHIRETWAVQPKIVVVEPDRAACLLESVRAGRLRQARGAPSNMGRLDCKDASLLAFQSLAADADAFATVSDEAAETAARLFAAHGLHTTPSGAASLAALMAEGLGAEARCLIVATEGSLADDISAPGGDGRHD